LQAVPATLSHHINGVFADDTMVPARILVDWDRISSKSARKFDLREWCRKTGVHSRIKSWAYVCGSRRCLPDIFA